MDQVKVILAILLISSSCREPINLDTLTNNGSELVIEGSISNAPGPYQVIISYSSINISNPTSFSVTEPEENAIVVLRDLNGNEEQAIHIGNGIYETSENFNTVVGETYTLQVRIEDDIYQSTPQTIPNSIPVEELNFRYNEEKVRVELLVNFQDPANETNHYTWSWSGFRQFRSLVPDDLDLECCDLCYLSLLGGNEFFVLEDRLYNGQRIIDFQVGHVPIIRPVEYLIAVEQKTITEETYAYFTELITQNENQGRLFDPIPYRIEGNLMNTVSSEKTLGLFYAYGSSTSTIQFHSQSFITDYSVLPRYYSEFEPTGQYCLQVPNTDTLKPSGWID